MRIPRYMNWEPHKDSISCISKMEDLLSTNKEGQQRLREVVERKEHWLAGHVEHVDTKAVSTEPKVPANTEGGNAAMATTDEV